MSRTLVIAVILALHVTASLCDLPEPDQELVDKYTALRDSFFKRLQFYAGKSKEALASQIEKNPEAKTHIENLQNKLHVEKTMKTVTDVASELSPLMDKARTTVLGLYGKYVRSWAGPYLDHLITYAREGLDQVLPINEQ